MNRTLMSVVGLGLFVAVLAGAWLLNDPLQAQESAPVDVSQNETLALGQMIYDVNCASCHGANGEGYASVQNAPALNGSEHAWHHPDGQILSLIRQGGNMMPAVGANWSDEEVEAVWAYVKQWWTPQQRKAQGGDIGERF